MNTGYARLLEAASELREWNTPAEVARGLTAGGFPVSDQIMTNWKSRGISSTGILDACKIIGCRCEFIRSGQLPIADAKRVEPFSHIATRAAELIDAMPQEERLKTLHYIQVYRESLRNRTV